MLPSSTTTDITPRLRVNFIDTYRGFCRRRRIQSTSGSAQEGRMDPRLNYHVRQQHHLQKELSTAIEGIFILTANA
ncbi:hypothetical protein CUMW_139360 [Citrus unshiu]|uniref:Uncharacterized protein n=1 Tax=Citrus unshiu TaxID=55188 RepID=A0A2H5PJ30_CITUN|nr:hypothetical protein CUMW_139360 [Citrus unshiu]